MHPFLSDLIIRGIGFGGACCGRLLVFPVVESRPQLNMIPALSVSLMQDPGVFVRHAPPSGDYQGFSYKMAE
jgi:hypothetical protein